MVDQQVSGKWMGPGWFVELRNILLMNFTIGVALTLTVYLFSGGRVPLLRLAIGNQIYSQVIGTLASLVIPRIAIRLATQPPWILWPVYVLCLGVIGAVGAALSAAVLLALGWFSPEVYARLFLDAARIAALITIIIGVATFVVESLKERLRTTTVELRTQQFERERAAKLATEAQLNSLQSRLQPHFLFNTINSVQSLIIENPKQAEDMLGRLSRLLRYSLDSQQRTLVPLAEEIRLLTDYLEIERVRFGQRLRFNLDVPADLGEILVPPYSLQTLVENSMKFAVAPRREGGRITVSARRDNSSLQLKVSDDGPGFSREAISEGHGLHTLEKRLGTLFGENSSLEVKNGKGAQVTVRLPA